MRKRNNANILFIKLCQNKYGARRWCFGLETKKCKRLAVAPIAVDVDEFDAIVTAVEQRR